MNKTIRKILAGVLGAAMCLACTQASFADPGTEKAETQETTTEAELTASVSGAAEDVAEKDETVYVLTGADGSVRKIIASDWIKTSLEDSYSQKDVEKELPVSMTVTYSMNGQKLSADEIAGKSGRVTIRFDYENRQYEQVMIDGHEERMYVPFAMITGILLDNEHFRNIEISNGKLINDGDHTAVVGFALPGLQENLRVDRDKLDIPDHFEISADVTDFKMGMTVTIAANELFNEFDTEKLDSVDALTDSIGELKEGMEQLLDGSSQLYDGLSTLLEKSHELADGADKLAAGGRELKNGSISLDEGAGQIKDGAAELSSGLDTLKSNNAALNGGAKQVFDTLLETAETQIRAGGIQIGDLNTANYADVLNGVISSLDTDAVYAQALTQVTAAVEANRSVITQKVTEAVREQVGYKVTEAVREQVFGGVSSAVRQQVTSQVITAATGLSMADYSAAVDAGLIAAETQEAVAAAIEAQMQTPDVQALIETNSSAQMGSDEVRALIDANIEAQMQTEAVQNTIAENTEIQVQQLIAQNMASDEVQSMLAAAAAGAQQIIALKTSLDSYNAFYMGLRAYTQGVADAADGAARLKAGAAELKSGTSQLRAGASELSDGIGRLTGSMPALIDGVTQLKDGSHQLDEGLKKFDEDGIQKIVELADGDLADLTARIRATADVSKAYRCFSEAGDDLTGQVRFIYRTDEIGK